MLAVAGETWTAPRLELGKPTSAATLALAGSVAVHAAFLLAPGASPRMPEPAVAAASVVQVRLVATAPAASAAPERVASSIKSLARVTPSLAAKPAEARDSTVELPIPVTPTEGVALGRMLATGESTSPPDHEPVSAPPTQVQILAAVAAPTPVGFLNVPEPDYPASAREEGQEGLVILRVRVSKEGRPVEILVGKSSGIRALDVAALAGVKRWTFRPARVADQDVEAWMDVPIRFRLR